MTSRFPLSELVRPVSVAELVADLGGEAVGDCGHLIGRLAPLESADGCSISFLASAKFRHGLSTTGAGCVVVRHEDSALAMERLSSAILTPDPYLYFARLTQWWRARRRPAPLAGIHPSAVIGEAVQIDRTATVGPFSVIGSGTSIGARVQIGSLAAIGADVEIGEATRLAAGVQIADGCRLGARGVVHGGVVIGADGFGFAPHAGAWIKIEQLGAVSIGDDVEIGANTCIDRGALDDTVIGDGVKLDNLIQIAHNVRIGDHTAMAGCVGVAGSARIGSHCTIGGAAMILGHLDIADHVHISAASVVMSSLLKPGHYSGVFPIDDNSNWEKNAATLRHLYSLRTRLRALEKKTES